VTQDHERIDELLAGYVLRSLSGEDAARADRLLSEHVPTCVRCRATLTDFQAIMADLALEAAPMAPPDALLPRLHRELGAPASGRRPMRAFAVAASVVLVAGLTGLAVTQGMRANHGAQRAALLTDAMEVASRADAKTEPVGPATEISAPGLAEFYLFGSDVPAPDPGRVYRVWLVSGTTPTFVGEFLPDAGFVAIAVPFDPSRYDGLWITQAASGSAPTPPAPSDAVWHT
jgi:Anti-sigma-K factor rskA